MNANTLLVAFAIAALLSCLPPSDSIIALPQFPSEEGNRLASAVMGQNTGEILKLGKTAPAALNEQDKKWGMTLLYWAVGTERFEAVKALLEAGASPNIPTRWNNETPLFLAAGYSFVDNDAKKDPKYVEILLRYGANPNLDVGVVAATPAAQSLPAGQQLFQEDFETALMEAVGSGFGKVKALVEAGADVNRKTPSGRTAAYQALLLRDVESAHYLIAEKHARVSEPYQRGKLMAMPGENERDEFPMVDLLRDWIFELDSESYRLKKEIIQEFARQGVDYWKTKIPADRFQQIQELHPKDWKDFAAKY